jgi:hypothetical protein
MAAWAFQGSSKNRRRILGSHAFIDVLTISKDMFVGGAKPYEI